MKIYLDVCCLNRPFDDQSHERIRLEAEAVTLVIKRMQTGDWQWISSPVVTAEIRRTPDEARRQAVLALVQLVDQEIAVTPAINKRTRELTVMGFKSFDAAHLACAEAGADVFLTTDDRLLRVAARQAGKLEVQTANPLAWLQERL